MSNACRNWKRKAAGVLLLAGCLVAGPAFSQEIIKWVDEDGVTHFGHAATAARPAMREHMQDEADEPNSSQAAGAASQGLVEPAAATAATLAAESPPRLSANGSE